MAEFKTFMDITTGRVGEYPDHYASIPTFVEVDPDDIPCIDCLPDDLEPEQDELDDEIDPVIPTTTTQRKFHNGR